MAVRSAQPFIRNAEIQLIPSPCKDALARLVESVQGELHIVSPYITQAGTAFITSRIDGATRRQSIDVRLLTDLNPLSVCQGSCDPEAILDLTRSFRLTMIHHLPEFTQKS